MSRDQDARGTKVDAGPDAPHIGAPSARFIGADGSVFAMVGTVLDRSKVSGGSPVHVLIAPGAIREYEEFFLPVFEFFKTPRDSRQVQEWLAWADAPSDFLTALVDTGAVVRIDTIEPLRAAESLRGIRVVAQSMPGGPVPEHPMLAGVQRDISSPVTAYITVELERVLWGPDEPMDVSSAINNMAAESGERIDLVARRVLTGIPRLLRSGLARLEWLRAPGL